MQPVRSTTEIQFLGDDLEGAEMAEFHGSPLSIIPLTVIQSFNFRYNRIDGSLLA